MKKRGFTLIELMVVIAIIGLLAAIALPRFAGVSDSAKVANVQGNLSSMRTSIAMFHAKNDAYPTLKGNEDKLGDVLDSSTGGTTGGEAFTNFYGKTKLAATPANSATVTETNAVEDAKETSGNSITGTLNGGWAYRKDDGAIRADLPRGVYGEDSTNGTDWSEF